MSFKPNLLALCALCCVVAFTPAAAQTVYKCGARGATYTDKPCSNRIVNTDEAAVPRKEVGVRRIEQNRLMAQAMRRRPGESAGEFEVRRRRARMLAEDRAECARLDKRMPVQQATMNHPDKEDAAQVAAALKQSRRRFSELRC